PFAYMHYNPAYLFSALSYFLSLSRAPPDLPPFPTRRSSDLGHARGVGNGHVLERGAHHLLAVLAARRDAHRVVGGLVVRAGRGLAVLDVDGAERVLGGGQAADGRALAVRRLAVHLARGAVQRDVVRGDLDLVLRRVDADVHVAVVVVDVIAVLAQFAGPALRQQRTAVDEDHVVVEAVQRGAHALALDPPPGQR